MGVSADHPWARRLAARPWRDAQDVLRLSLRRLPDVFVITPAGALIAPNFVQLLLNPGDFGSLCELMDIGLINASATEVYREQAAARGARWARPGPAEVSVAEDPSVPPGRYRMGQGRAPRPGPWPVWPGPAAGFRHARDGHTRSGASPAGTAAALITAAGPAATATGLPTAAGPAGTATGLPTAAGTAGTATGLPTVTEPAGTAIPPLRLVTGDCVVQTRTSGARAGRGAVDLVLPQVPTVSREHARFTFAGGQWWVANLGRNGLILNGVPLVAGQPLRDGDCIRWGSTPDALLSRVEIG
jgi:hypothetical protein